MDTEFCITCGESFDDLGLLPDERFVCVDGSLACGVDCCHDHDNEVWESDAYPVLPIYLD